MFAATNGMLVPPNYVTDRLSEDHDVEVIFWSDNLKRLLRL